MAKAVLNVDLPSLPLVRSGKVRDIFRADGRLVLVSTDRLSAFDVIMHQGVPGRGVVLTRLSEFWFRRLASICPHHLLSTDLADMPSGVQAQAETLAGRTMLVEALDIVPVECVVRGYLAGSGWKEYQRTRTVCGVSLPEGLVESAALPEPIFTPTTKSDEKDEPITFREVEEAIGADQAAQLRDLSLRLYQAGAEYARERGIILADTKFEFGVRDGELRLADEALTPDSSRYWDAETYEPGRSQDSFDKQIVRDWLEQSDWNKQPPPPTLPDEIIEKTARRYEEIAQRLMA
jgi:phosphoribosylaminoimidazole-succinocarboxamide synthase